MTTFRDLGLSETILRALETEGYVTPTPIQAQSIPVLMQGRDLLGIAQTGTGKTAAFALPIIDKLLAQNIRPQSKNVRVLVLAPTRELAAQIAESFKAYARNARLSIAVIVGGVGFTPQTQALLRGLDVLVATPGRLLDHMQQGNLRLDMTETVVLDEADHMLDLGFVVPIRKIIAKLPKVRQNLFFSATMPKEIAALAAEMLKDPVRVEVTPLSTTAERIDQQAILLDAAAKRHVLVELLANPKFARTIVFTRTKRGADRVSEHLEKAGIGAAAIHGNKSQGARMKALEGFKSGRTRVLVATDIAARGIDVDMVSHVINFELPDVPESYVHRIGRTARAGAEGIAISLVDHTERHLLKQIERLTRQTIPLTDRRNDKSPLPEVDETVTGHNRHRRAQPQQQQRSHGAPRGAGGGGNGQRNNAPRNNGPRPPQGAGAAAPRPTGTGGNRSGKPGGARTEQRS